MLKFFLAAFLVAAPCLAQEAPEASKIIAIDAEDAATCEAGCARITKEAQKAIMDHIRKLEALATQQAGELKKQPKYCL